MYLYEEFFKRKGISAPMVQHVENGYLFFRDKVDDKTSRLIMSISWDGNIYLIKFLAPIQNSTGYSLFSRLGKEIEVEWGDYESFFLKWSKEAQKSSVIDSKDAIKLFAWECFCLCFDVDVYTKLDNKTLMESLNCDLSDFERYKAMEACIVCLLFEHERLYKSWDNKFLSMTENYCHWLVDLVHND